MRCFVVSHLDLPEDYFQPYLEAGWCIVLFDGLDEVADTRERGAPE
jgi:predicted NACHT family NTPase